MADLMMAKGLGALRPADAESEEYLRSLAAGEVVRVKVWKPRNPQFHRKFFALLKLGFDNQNTYSNFDHWRRAVTIEAGFFEDLKMLDGTTVREAKSISWGSMDELEFSRLYYAALDVIANFLGIENEVIQQELAQFAWQGGQ